MDEPKKTGETPDAGSIASEATVQVRSIIHAAEGVADALKREAERRSEMRVRDAEAEAARLMTIARREADDLVADRRRRIAELSDLIMQRAEATLAGLEEAGAAKRQLQEVLVTLEETAQRLVRDAEAAGIEAAARIRAASATSEVSEREPAASTVPDSSAERKPSEPRPVERKPSEPRPADTKPAEPSGSEARGADTGPNGDGAEPVSTEKGAADVRPGAAKAGGSSAGKGDGKDVDRFGGARQVAFQMAVAGSTRAEVAAHLQRVFELPDPHPILNEVFGDAEVKN